jgi:hypothetical protein
MAEYGEWIRKGATLSDVTAVKEYGVSREFILKGIRAGRLEFRKGAVWLCLGTRAKSRDLARHVSSKYHKSGDGT